MSAQFRAADVGRDSTVCILTGSVLALVRGAFLTRDVTVVVPRDQEKICDHFNIPADERLAPPEYHESMYR